jgi:hypothetical protein
VRPRERGVQRASSTLLDAGATGATALDAALPHGSQTPPPSPAAPPHPRLRRRSATAALPGRYAPPPPTSAAPPDLRRGQPPRRRPPRPADPAPVDAFGPDGFRPRHRYTRRSPPAPDAVEALITAGADPSSPIASTAPPRWAGPYLHCDAIAAYLRSN